MEREQAKKQFIKETMDEEYRSSMTGSDQYCAGMEIGLSEGFDAGYDAAAGQQQWVDVDDRLPDKVGEYLVTLAGDGAIRNALFEDGDWNDPDFGASYDTDSQSDVIAWMPLPAPYQRPSAVVEGEGE